MKYLLYLFGLLFFSSSFSAALEDQKEIRMASEGAPKHITDNASFLKYENGAFSNIKTGSNNFTCLVVRDPKGRYEPSCFNEEAMRSVFPSYALQMNLLFAGASYDEANKKILDAFKNKEIPTAETGALVYMMSPKNKMYKPKLDKLVPTPIHHMYFYPKLSDKTFSLEKGSPRLWQGFPHMSALIVVIDK